jgi:hypothetical protein
VDQSLSLVRRFHKEGEQLLLRGYSPFALGPPPLHHICVRSTAVYGGSRRSASSENRLDSVHDALWRSNVGLRTDLKIMVSSV